MKGIVVVWLVAISFLAVNFAQAAVPTNVIGRILLQVESHGEAWYVLPDTKERFYIKNGAAAYASLRTFGLGITNSDLAKIPVGIEERFEDLDTDGDGLADKLEEALKTDVLNTDTDGDGFEDGAEVEAGYNPTDTGLMIIDDALIQRLQGQIILQVESRGEAWYVHPVDGKRYYMKNGEAAYAIMQFLSLGITDLDLDTIPLLSTQLDCGDSLDCFLGAVESDVAATATISSSLNILGIVVESIATLEHQLLNDQGLYTYITTAHSTSANGEIQPQLDGVTQTCVYSDKYDMAEVIGDWIVGNSSTSDLDFANCVTFIPGAE